MYTLRKYVIKNVDAIYVEKVRVDQREVLAIMGVDLLVASCNYVNTYMMLKWVIEDGDDIALNRTYSHGAHGLCIYTGLNRTKY